MTLHLNLQGAADEAEEVVEQKGTENQQRRHDDDRGVGVCGSEPGKPDGEKVFAKAESPIAERFRHRIDRGAGGCFSAMGGKGNSTGKQRGGPAPFGANSAGGSIGDYGRGRRADESVQGIPDGVEPEYFVREKLDEIETYGDAQDDGMADNGQRIGQMDETEALKQAKSGDRGVQVEAGRKAGTEGEAESFDGVHRGRYYRE